MTGLIVATLAAVALAALALPGVLRRNARMRAAGRALQHAARPENQLTAHVYGDSIDAFKDAALERARVLYGPGVHLVAGQVWNIHAHSSERFSAAVLVRNYGPPLKDGRQAPGSSHGRRIRGALSHRVPPGPANVPASYPGSVAGAAGRPGESPPPGDPGLPAHDAGGRGRKAPSADASTRACQPTTPPIPVPGAWFTITPPEETP